jgi:small subunit ribosomal protein S6
MRCYESTLALHPDLGEAGVLEQMERVRQIIAAHGGSVREVAEWGQRDLAYPIRKQRRAMFQVVVYDGTGATVSELERNLRISDHILRYITVKVDPNRGPLDIGRHRRASSEDEEGGSEDAGSDLGDAEDVSGDA